MRSGTPLAVDRAWVEAALVLGLAATHVAAVWGSVGLAWGDYGVWLHAVERAAAGETAYVDFYWMYPPLALWILSGVTRALGTSLPVIWTTTTVIYGAIIGTFWLYVRALLPNAARLPVLGAGILLALAYANHQSAPLPLGMYTPAAPLAGLLLLVGAVLLVRITRGTAPGASAALGAITALAVFTKQDAWPPAAFAAIASTMVLWHRRERRSLRNLVLSFVGVLASLALILAAQVDWSRILWAFWTPNVLGVLGGRGLPTWERLTVQIGALAIGFFGVAVILRVWAPSVPGVTRVRVAMLGSIGLACVALHVAMSVRAGVQLRLTTPGYLGPVQDAMLAVSHTAPALAMGAVQFTGERLLWYVLPPLLPGVVALWLIATWKSPAIAPATRRVLFVLLGYALAARLRRQFELVDWYHVLLELPIYAAALSALVPARALRELRAVALVFLMLVPVGALAYYEFGRGPFTENVARATFAMPNKGTLRVSLNGAADLTWLRAALDSVDPTGRRPLMTHGQTGGFNYYVDRSSATSLMSGFRLTHTPADHVAREITTRHPSRLMLDVAVIDRLTEVRTGVDFTRWDLNVGPTVMTHDRALFDRLRSNCPRVAHKGNALTPGYVLYGCDSRVEPVR